MGPACLAQTAPVDTISTDFLPAPGILGQGPRVTPPQMPPVTCFAEGTDPAVVASVNQAMARYLEQNFFNSPAQWGSQGQPITLTWSLVPDGLNIPGDPNVGDATSPSNLFSTMDAKFGGIANRATWIAQLQACFDRWAQLTGITFNRVSVAGQAWDDGGAWGTASSAFRGTIRIAMHPIDGPNGILGFCYFPTNANGSGGDMVLDSSENWGNAGDSYRFLRNVVSHEMGHGLGLMHVCPTNQTKLMEPYLSLNYDGPQHDDVRGMQYLYGDAFEPNNTPATATQGAPTVAGNQIVPSYVPGTLVPGVYMTSLNSGDEDWFKSTVTDPILTDFTVEPVGSTYDSSSQNANGTCNSGNNINSVALADLAIQVYAPDGTTLWASANAYGPGVTEDLNDVLLSPGTYYIRVYSTNIFAGSQMYWFSYIGRTYPRIYASTGDFNTKVRVTWDFIPYVTETAIYRATSPNRAQATLLGLLGQNAGTTWDDTTVAQGVTYYYWVDAQQGNTGGLRPATLQYASGYAGATPANNTCANAYPIAEGDFYGSTTYATNDGTTSCGVSNSSKDVWYHFYAPADGTVKFSTCGTNDMPGVDMGMDTVLSLHSGCPGTAANTLMCSDDASGPINCVGSDSGNIRDSALTYNVARNQELMVRVAGYSSSSGEFMLHVHYLPPSNDLCANAFPAANGSTPFSSAGAGTDGPDEPGCGGSYTQIGRDVWFRYTATCTGTATADLCGSEFDSKIAAYHGTCPLVPGTVIACNDDSYDCAYNAKITFPVVSGQDYLIRCGGYWGQNGNGVLNMSCTSSCGSADFNCDGDSGTDADIEAFFSCVAGNCPTPPCTSTADFNDDGDVGTDADIEAFFRVLAGGNC
jgi:hypothetical protein